MNGIAKNRTSAQTPGVFPLFFKYVSANVLGMIGYSCYILADTFFIARGIGADALAALNLAIPAYNLMNGTGLMIGMGAAARWALSSAQPQKDTHRTIFTQALYLAAAAAVIFFTAGLLFAPDIAFLLGADNVTLPYAAPYLRVLLLFAPLFLSNNVVLCFVRNDGAPGLAMAGMISGSLSNIVLDYVFIYPLGMEMAGAAIATGIAPVISLVVLSTHFIRKQNHFHPVKTRPSITRAADICSLGVSSLIAEVSSGIVIIIFNFLILDLNGNMGVAAYGILANIALVLTAVFTGIAQGIQPIVSRYSGSEGATVRRSTKRYALCTALLLSLAAYVAIVVFAVPIADLFNRDHDPALSAMAADGMRIYFISLFFTGINVIAAAFLSSADRPKQAFVISALRGFLLIIPAAWLLSRLFGLTGVWLALPVTEAIVCMISAIFLIKDVTAPAEPPIDMEQ